MSIPSCYNLHAPSDSEFMPMSDAHVPLPGDPDFVPLSEEDRAKLIAAHQSGETSPEVCTLLDVLSKYEDDLMSSMINEDALAGPADGHVDGSNDDESPAMQQGTLADSQYVQNPQTSGSFPTSENFTAPVAGLPQLSHIDQGLYYTVQTSAIPQAPHEYDHGYFTNGPPSAYYTQPSVAPQGPAWSQHEYNPEYYANGPPGAYYSQSSAVIAAPPQGHALAQHGYHPAPSYPYQQPPTIAGPSNVDHPTETFPQGQYAPLQTESSEDSDMELASSALDGTARPRKRKTHLAPTTRKRRRPNMTDDCTPGKFGPYTPADASATIMTKPIHDPKPVDISSRRTHDPNGNPLRTRRFGAMELDDTYPDGSGNVPDRHSPQLICVRSCDWTDQPCGLFIEMDKARIEHHLWFWHGVEAKKPTPCQFKDCPDAGTMMYLSRHIGGVHFDTSYQCPYCKKLWSRTDALVRHQKGCKRLLASRAHAKHGKYEFSLQAMIKSVSGYIVPARNAT
ncbi:uncharacterized protein EDB93DRAFT_1250248 [Suillus bovinus]|uniref:uncharacterized protein n=1 Tax=Suillus bovinus TaxID=48563 RepID=UPI001B870216|nr:uncharacterized protein EDB93DRAFT_1250248 [Suillus bovinus]KAG2148180.1 hypothetical protein EDB93DRAFT_1250248 [Suillus bovinus]